MGQNFTGKVNVETSDPSPIVTITLDGDGAGVSAGGNGHYGTVSLMNSAGTEVLHLGEIFPAKPAKPGVPGPGEPVGPSPSNGSVVVKDAAGHETINLWGADGSIKAGGNGADGSLWMKYKDGNNRVTLEASTAMVLAGGSGADAQLGLFPASAGWTTDMTHATIHLRASDGTVRAGGAGTGGRFYAVSKDDKSAITLGFTPDGNTAELVMGGHGADGIINLTDAKGKAAISCDGTKGNITLSGDIFLTGADCAEQFDIAPAMRPEPGTVMVIDQEGTLRPSWEAYDRKVAGVISGAGDLKPGIVLDRQQSSGSGS